MVSSALVTLGHQRQPQAVPKPAACGHGRRGETSSPSALAQPRAASRLDPQRHIPFPTQHTDLELVLVASPHHIST